MFPLIYPLIYWHCLLQNNLSSSGDKDDYSELPPNQRRKKILQKLDEIQAKLHQEIAAK